jgi:hypothetical protein
LFGIRLAAFENWDGLCAFSARHHQTARNRRDQRSIRSVCPTPDKKRILWAAGDVTENRPPLSRWHPDYVDLAKQACS